MRSKSIPEILEEIGTLLEIKGENPFKARAYHNAAKIISGMDNIEEMIDKQKLKEIKGIGETIASRIEEYLEKGKIEYLEELKKEVPESLLELIAVPNLGPKKIKVLYDELGIRNIGELEYACMENRLINLPGFGQKTQEKILKGIEFLKKHKGEFLFGEVFPEAERIKERFLERVDDGFVEICGSIRRRKEVVKDIDILVAGDDYHSISSFFTSLPEVDSVMLQGDTKTSCRLKSGIEADLRVVKKEAFPYALMYFTGSKEHNVRMRGLSKKRGWKLNEYGLFEGERFISCRSEEEIYRMHGLDYIPPELREDTGEIEASEKGSLPELVKLSDIRGTFHIHTELSDGIDPIERLAEVAKKMGFSYIGISDHSQTAYYARGLKKDAIFKQWEIIDRLNRKNPDFHIFKGIESDIHPDGSLDYDEEVLKGFDFVIASIHSAFNLKKEDQERRIIKALENKYTTMLGHPTGRLLLSRDGYEVDMRRIIDSAYENGVIIELNASPYRLDIDWRYLKYAKEKGVMVSINPDAHSALGIEDVKFGINIARKGWQEKRDILNTKEKEEVIEILRRKREKPS
ncbi:MAG: DNA polymerase/3'-5' exonuclease PolX [Syntrophorhabdaceae bacterium]|nr:DNA polymerase/3'-5' exonuclease PolX [Syntrophorhabdaceae bacterium]